MVGPLTLASCSCSGRCSTISICVPEAMLTSAPRVKSATMPAVASPAAAPSSPPASGWPTGAPRSSQWSRPSARRSWPPRRHYALCCCRRSAGSRLRPVHLLMLRARQAVDHPGNLNHRAVGENHGREVHVELRLLRANTTAGTNNGVDHALHINASRDHHTIADDDRKRGVKINAVAGLGALGVDGAARFQ